MPLILALASLLLICGLVENHRHQKNLRRIPIRILVNGTRGKSSVTRLIAGALREAGCPTVAKATGSEARIILEDGSELPVERRLGPRITEQKALAKLAVERRAKALVVECMAVRPESQMVMQSQLVRATISVITNVRVDHIDEMGGTLEDTASALSLTIPRQGSLVTSESRFADGGCRVRVIDGSGVTPDMLERFSYPVFAENIALALGVAEELGIDRETALRGMAKSMPDVGVVRLFKVDFPSFQAILINAFAANDAASTLMVWHAAMDKVPAGLPLFMLYNGRADREYRISQFMALPSKIEGIRLVATTGQYAKKAARLFSRLGLETFAFEEGTGGDALLSTLGARAGGSFILFGVGNFHGMGQELAAYCAKQGSPL